MSETTGPVLTLQELPELRRKTESVSRSLRDQISAHLETLRPMFAPERVFGKHAGGKVEVAGAERALAELQQSYKPFSRKPYDLPETFDGNWLGLVGSALELYPWEYVQEVQGKPIVITSPVRWVVNYRNNYNLAQAKAALEGKQAVHPENLRQFAVNSLVLQSFLSRNPGLIKLFQDLRFEVKSETPPDLKGLPIITITSGLTSFRPTDDLIAAAIAFSGVPAFIELLDLAALRQAVDPAQARLDALLK